MLIQTCFVNYSTTNRIIFSFGRFFTLITVFRHEHMAMLTFVI